MPQREVPAARRVDCRRGGPLPVSSLLVRGGVRLVASAQTRGKLNGVNVGKPLPIPDIGTKKFPEAKAHEEKAPA